MQDHLNRTNISQALITKIILGMGLMALSFITGAFYQIDFKNPISLALIAFFSAGLYLVISNIESLQQFKQAFRFLLAAAVMTWGFFFAGWINYIYATGFGHFLVDLTTRMTTTTLNFIGIHAVQNSSFIMLPAASKIPLASVLPECTGLGSILLFLGAYVLMLLDMGRRVSKKKAMSLLAIAVPTLYFLSVLRISFLVLMGYLYGQNGVEPFHQLMEPFVLIVFFAFFWRISLRWVVKPNNVDSSFCHSCVNSFVTKFSPELINRFKKNNKTNQAQL